MRVKVIGAIILSAMLLANQSFAAQGIAEDEDNIITTAKGN